MSLDADKSSCLCSQVAHAWVKVLPPGPIGILQHEALLCHFFELSPCTTLRLLDVWCAPLAVEKCVGESLLHIAHFESLS